MGEGDDVREEYIEIEKVRKESSNWMTRTEMSDGYLNNCNAWGWWCWHTNWRRGQVGVASKGTDKENGMGRMDEWGCI